MAAINESISFITCQCGRKFQKLKTLEDGNPEWDEEATSAAYQAHLLKCKSEVS